MTDKFRLLRVNGRLPRQEFLKHLALIIILGVALFLAPITRSFSVNWFTLVSSFLMIPSTTRRLHDINRSGWWQATYLLPISLGILFVVINLLWMAGQTPVMVRDAVSGNLQPHYQSGPFGQPGVGMELAAYVVYFTWFFYYLPLLTGISLLRGTKEENKYGPDPLKIMES